MPSVPSPSKTLLAVLVVGALCGAVPFLLNPAGADTSQTYRATAFDPATEADVLAHRSNNVTNLTDYHGTNRTQERIRRAANGETVTADNDSDIESLTHDTGYGVYRGEYYYVNATERDDTVTLRLEPRSPEAAMRALAVEYDAVRPEVQRVVDQGNATVEGQNSPHSPIVHYDVPSVVERNGTYYVLEPTNPLAILGQFLRFWLVSALLATTQWLAAGYLGTALAVLGLMALCEDRHPLTMRSGLAVAGVVGVLFGLTAMAWQSGVSQPGDLGSLGLSALMSVPSGVALSLTLLVGVGLRPKQSASRPLAAATLVFGAIGVGAAVDAAMTGSVVLFFVSTVTDAIATFVFGLPLVALGYVHASALRGDGSAGEAQRE